MFNSKKLKKLKNNNCSLSERRKRRTKRRDGRIQGKTLPPKSRETNRQMQGVTAYQSRDLLAETVLGTRIWGRKLNCNYWIDGDAMWTLRIKNSRGDPDIDELAKIL